MPLPQRPASGRTIELAGATAAELTAVPFEIEPEEPGMPPPCPLRYQLAFATPQPLLFLQFRNFYVATVTLEAQPYDASAPKGTAPEGPSGEPVRRPEPPWQQLVSSVSLMNSPHFEKDAQAWHRLFVSPAAAAYVAELEQHDDLGSAARAPVHWPAIPLVMKLRLTLAQPSPSWTSCRLEQLSCFKASSVTKPAARAAPYVTGAMPRGAAVSANSDTPRTFEQSMQDLMLTAAHLRHQLAPAGGDAESRPLGGGGVEATGGGREAVLPAGMLGLGLDLHACLHVGFRSAGPPQTAAPQSSGEKRRPAGWPQKAATPSPR